MKLALRLVVLMLCLCASADRTSAAFLRIDGELPGGGDCALFGDWDAQSATCVVQDAVLPEGDRLDIVSATLLVAGTMTNDGLLVNDGTLLVPGMLINANDLVNNWTATAVVSGDYFSHFMYQFGSLTVEPTGSVNFDFFVENNGPLINQGHIRIGEFFFNIPERLIENLGSMQIAAIGQLTNAGVFVHAGQLDNQGTLQNDATFVEHCDSELTGNPLTGEAATGAQSLQLARETLNWCEVPGAIRYTVVSGRLDMLQGSGGDYSIATTDCLGDSIQVLAFDHTALPATNGGLWFLVRAEGIPTAGFDTVFSSQVGQRDEEIDASAAICR